MKERRESGKGGRGSSGGAAGSGKGGNLFWLPVIRLCCPVLLPRLSYLLYHLGAQRERKCLAKVLVFTGRMVPESRDQAA
jgi:hypothetical protein